MWRNWTNSSLLKNNSSTTAAAARSTATPRYAGLTSAQELVARQRAADGLYDQRARRASLSGLTLRTALEDVREVLVELPIEAYSSGGSLAGLLTKNDRLRGLGLALLAGTLLALALL